MRSADHTAFAVCLIGLLTLSFASTTEASTQPLHGEVKYSATRMVPLTIKVVFVGFNPEFVDTNYIVWEGNLPEQKSVLALATGNRTGVEFNLTYKFDFAGDNLRDRLTAFLKGHEETNTTYNPWFGFTVNNIFYDALSTESWLLENAGSFGGLAQNGYTIILANLTTLPSTTLRQLDNPFLYKPTPHYYKLKYVDSDLGYRIRFREFAVGWGGNSRLWFLDLSAGPEFWTWDNPDPVPHIPIQVALELSKVDLRTPQGRRWFTQYLSDYIFEAVWNLAVPSFTYQPTVASGYSMVINLFDNRTEDERREIPITSTINRDLIRIALEDLLPYASIELEVNIWSLNETGELYHVILNSTQKPPEVLQFETYVDLRPVYLFLQKSIHDYVPALGKEPAKKVIPVFAFAFPERIRFGYTYKWLVGGGPLEFDTIFAVSLGDMAIVGLNQHQFQRGDHVFPRQPKKGIGFTQIILHEIGHMLGLAHPSEYGFLGDFVSSAMSLFAWEYRFSQFDKDAIQRAHADQLIMQTIVNLEIINGELVDKLVTFEAKLMLRDVENLLEQADAEYLNMRYAKSLELGRRALEASGAALKVARSLPSLTVVNSIASLALGIGLGVVISVLLFRRGSRFDRGGNIDS